MRIFQLPFFQLFQSVGKKHRNNLLWWGVKALPRDYLKLTHFQKAVEFVVLSTPQNIITNQGWSKRKKNQRIWKNKNRNQSKFAIQSQKFSTFLQRQTEPGRAGQGFPSSLFGLCCTVLIADLTLVLFQCIAKICQRPSVSYYMFRSLVRLKYSPILLFFLHKHKRPLHWRADKSLAIRPF